MSNEFKLESKFKPAGSQPAAISALVDGLKKGFSHQTLFGVTGSGKTFTVANIINQIQKPTLVIAHNKTLAAQLAQEYRAFFPHNAVHYFVSYYDYYQPEAYIPTTDTYIEKEAMINEEIDRLRHASTQALLTRKDVIIVASVSCIYGLGSPAEYEKVNLKIFKGQQISRGDLIRAFVGIHFERTIADLAPGQFRALGNSVEIMPVSEKVIFRIEFGDGEISGIQKIDPISRAVLESDLPFFFLFPAKHFITDKEQVKTAIATIKSELKDQLKIFEKEGKLLEAERLKRRTNYDLALIREVGYCNGIENYSRHFSGKLSGEPPDTLLSYFPHFAPKDGASRGEPDFLTIIDESHVTVPQLHGMFAGDASRKNVLIEHGFRLPSARDNRPLKFGEFSERVGQVIYTSATPGKFEKEKSERVAEQVIRPTGLIDPEVLVRPVSDFSSPPARGGVPSPRGGVVGEKNHPVRQNGHPSLEKEGRKPYGGQIADFISEAEKVIKKGERAIATTLTKKMAEDLSEYLKDPTSLPFYGSSAEKRGTLRGARKQIKTAYLHSDIDTLERIKILTDFRKGKFDCLVGVNLLREGLDLPELSFIGILDADKEGFLRSETSLIQTIGRAARNVNGRVILYADNLTDSMNRAISETNRRRALQIAYNEKRGITPKTIEKKIHDITEELESEHQKAVKELLALDREVYKGDKRKMIRDKEKQMSEAVRILDFETAALLRDEILAIQKNRLETKKLRN